MAELVCQLLQLVRLEPVVIPEDVIVSGSAGALDAYDDHIINQIINTLDTGYLGESKDKSQTL